MLTRYGELPIIVHGARAEIDRSLTPAPRPLQTSAPGYRSKLEASYAQQLAALQHAGAIASFGYEAITLKLADRCRFTPDFHVITAEGRHEFHEVKGWAREDAMVKLRVAARIYPWARFVLIRREKGRWTAADVAR